MRKRPSRPRRFAAVDNDAIDALPSILGVGLLTCLIRAKDGASLTVESLAECYDEGEKSLTKAMRSLVDGAYVVKFKIQRATTEAVIEDGKEVVKRGGSWYTTFNVDSIPFTAADVAAMLEEIYAEGNVKSHRVEPVRLDPKKHSGSTPSRPTPPGGGVGPTRDDIEPEGVETPNAGTRPTPPSGAPGRPTPGQGGAHIRKKTTSASAADEQPEDETDALAGRSPGDGRRPSDGSSTYARESGSAASGTTSPSPTPHDDTRRPAPAKKSSNKKPAHTREQLDQVRQVRALFPRELLDAEGGLPNLPTLSSAILAAMGEGRTVKQMRDRIWYRWANHGFADIWAEEGRFEKPVGVAVALVRPLRRGDRFACPDLRCENGADIDTKVPCRLCAERIADWKAEWARKRGQAAPRGANSVSAGAGSPDAALPSQRAAQPSAPLLRDCANDQCPLSVPTTGNPLCRPCQDDQAEAEQATRDMLAAWEAEKAAAATERPPKEVDEDALETARLRAELAAQYGTPDQQAAYCGSNAPF
ncbi:MULTISPECIES: hypothetical protein [unclassified Streptomyces]|uniref:hypothetical protein n=1 Tax=unclassified Streptomyces TaxID=2593676 RepID=UPI0008049ABB|nr:MULTISPECIES: hypothetical protein [unclassified Streptomyces]MYR75207.1 hypothetical protein [Streptomyces sp. SID4925]SBU98190.1 hypothetical protein YUMDRAFT_06087 [Streptomyces sp. OspMP-M45]